MISSLSAFMSRFVQRWLPDPLVFVALLTIIVFVWGLYTFEPAEGQNTILGLVGFWGDGFWSFLAFTTQMAMIVVTGYALASSEQVKSLLKAIAALAKTPKQAVALVCFFGGVASAINWGFGLVIGALLAKQVARRLKAVDYGLLIACAYMGFMTWGGGLSGSMPLAASDPTNIVIKNHVDGNIIPLTETIFTGYNLFVIAALLICIPFLTTFMTPKDPKIVDPALLVEEESFQRKLPKDAVPALKMEESRILALVIVVLAAAYLVYYFYVKGFLNGLNLNSVNLIFITVGLLLHKTPMAYMRAVKNAAGSTAGILIQFPFYAAIAGVMEHSGVGQVITEFFISIANKDSYPVWAFFSSAVINFAVPSGGGHWIIQGPFVMDAAKEIGADLGKSVMAIAYGEQWANMIQPFWALPALAIAGLGVRDIMGYCIIALLFSFPIFVIGLYFF